LFCECFQFTFLARAVRVSRQRNSSTNPIRLISILTSLWISLWRNSRDLIPSSSNPRISKLIGKPVTPPSSFFPENEKGVAYARQAILDYAIQNNDKWFWMIDDEH